MTKKSKLRLVVLIVDLPKWVKFWKFYVIIMIMHCLCKFSISNLFLSSVTVQNIFFDAIDLHNWLKLLLYKYCKNQVSTWKRSQGLWRICTSSSELWRTDNLVTQIRNLIRIAILVYWYNSASKTAFLKIVFCMYC